MPTPLVIAALFSLGAATAAASSPPRQPSDRATVTVQNDQKSNLVVYAERGDEDIRLGSVPALGTATFSLPAWLSLDREDVTFYVHPQNGFDQASDPVEVFPGERLGVLVRPA